MNNTLEQWSLGINKWAANSNILLPILLSIVAAIIFWMFFSYLPERKRRNKLRPIVELALFEVYTQLFSLFDLAMRDASNTSSFYQPEIRGGKLTQEKIALGLQNKCINHSYLFDPNLQGKLIVVGEELLNLTSGIEELANKVLSFHTFASAEELLLLEKIREKLRVYNFNERNVNKSCESISNGMIYRPANPTISYCSQNFFEIYQLFLNLQLVILDQKPINRDHAIYKIQSLYYGGKYKACAEFIKREGARLESISPLHKNYLALSELGNGRRKIFYKIIEETYEKRPYNGSLVSTRNTFSDLLGDQKLMEILAQFHSSEEIAAMRQCVQEERDRKERFERSNQALKYYHQKQK